MPKTWLITGAGRGLGRHWAEAALDRGDRVAATARDVDALAPLVAAHGAAVVPLALDVTDRDAVFAAVRAATDSLGRLDVVVNNAGYGHLGMVEELSEPEIRGIMEANFFGTLWVTQAVLPVLRGQGGGRLLQVTSEGGVRTFPGFGAYHASKWAVEGLSQTLAAEAAGFGVRVVIVEPGPYGTGFLDSARRSDPLPAYDAFRAGPGTSFEIGDAAATRSAVLRLADAEDPPLRVFLGRSFPAVEQEYLQRLETWRDWQDLSESAFE